MDSKHDKNIIQEISQIILSISLNIDHYNKENDYIIEQPAFSDFFDFFSKIKKIWIETVKLILKELKVDSLSISEDDQIEIATVVVKDMISYMYIQNIQYEFKKDNKNIETLTARKYIEEDIDTVKVEIAKKIDGEKIDIRLITRTGFINIIKDIIKNKEYTVLEPKLSNSKGHISSLLSGKFGGKHSRKYKKTKKNKKYKKIRFTRKNTKY